MQSLLLPLKKVNIPDGAKHSGNKPLTKIKKLRDNSSPLFNHESLGYLTAGVAREIPNPLKCVNNYAESSVEVRKKLLE